MQLDQAVAEYESIAPRDMLPPGFPSLPERRVLAAEKKRKKAINIQLITGGRGVVIPSRVFECIGLLDANHPPQYCSDHDFYFRCRVQGIALWVSADMEVNIDANQTALAEGVGSIDRHQFQDSLTDIRSHRNIPHLKMLFRKHCPLRGLYLLGVAMNVGRYTAIYLIKRTQYKLTRRPFSLRDSADGQ